MNEILERLYRIGVVKNALPPHLRGWVQELGLSVRVVEGGRRILAGGRWRSSVQARRGFDNEEWQLIKLDQAAWNRRFANVLEPTYEICEYLLAHAAGAVPEAEFISVLKEAIKDFNATGTWPNLHESREDIEGLSLEEKIQRYQYRQLHEHGVQVLGKVEQSIERNPLKALQDLDSISLDLQVLSYRAGDYKGLENDAARNLLTKTSYPWLPEVVRSVDHLRLGMIYFAALSYEHRGIGVAIWDDKPTQITAQSLGYDIDQLRALAIDHLDECLTHGQTFFKEAGFGGATFEEQQYGGSTAPARRRGLQCAVRAARTMSDEAFDEFDKAFEAFKRQSRRRFTDGV